MLYYKRNEVLSMDKLLTVNELAEYYSMSRETVYNWINRGCPYRELPSGRKRFKLSDVATWCDDEANKKKLVAER